MKMRCCEKVVTTPFCPQCGKKNGGPLAGLLEQPLTGVKASHQLRHAPKLASGEVMPRSPSGKDG